MRRLSFISIVFAVLLSSPFGVSIAAAQGPGGAASKVFTGEIGIPEVSGAAFLPGDRLLVVSDEGQTVYLLQQATEHLLSGSIKLEDFQAIDLDGRLESAGGKSRELDDLEDVAWDGQSHVFLVTSHSRNRKGKGVDKKPERFAIARLALEGDGVAAGKMPVFDLQVPADLVDAMARTPAQSGFNIEGAAWSPDGHLYLGLRSPTKTSAEDRVISNEDAILLEVGDPASSPMVAKLRESLDLKGNGIRGMLYDPQEHGLWILAGLSPDPPEDMIQARWSLWFRPDGGTLQEVELPWKASSLANAEAVARLTVGEQPYVLLVEDGRLASRYVLVPVPGR